MSKTQHRHYHPYKKYNTEYYRSCARTIRSKHHQMLRNLVPVCDMDELDEVLYHIPQKEYYNETNAPGDYTPRFSHLLNKEHFDKCVKLGEYKHKDLNREISGQRYSLIIRSRIKGFPLHARKKYPYKELIVRFLEKSDDNA